MTRTTVTLPDDLADSLRHEARRRETSVSEVMRQALSAHLGLVPGQKRTIAFAGIADSGSPDLVERGEELLADSIDDAYRDAFGRDR